MDTWSQESFILLVSNQNEAAIDRVLEGGEVKSGKRKRSPS
jgi:hypothetical protein